jgi:hypothetical protein
MDSVSVLDRPVATTWTDAQVLDGVAAIAAGPLRAAAPAIDRGHYPLDIMAELGRVGALGVHLKRHGGRLGLAIAAMEGASRACGSTGFLMWAHDVCGLYLENGDNPALSETLLEAHAHGRAFGGTALSNPMKALSGIESFALRARKVPNGYRVSGTLPWVSHIAPGQYCGAMAAVVDDAGAVSHEILFFLRCDERVQLRACPAFSGMEGTSTWGVRVDDLFVGADDLLADPARPFVARIRESFILLQTGMALGVVAGSVEDMRQVEPVMGRVNSFLSDRPDELAAEAAELRARVMRLAETPFDGGKDYRIEVLDARIHGAELALRAAQSALLHQGARGYLADAAPQRRVREAHFCAIVTPAIKHLRFEVSKLMTDEYPS